MFSISVMSNRFLMFADFGFDHICRQRGTPWSLILMLFNCRFLFSNYIFKVLYFPESRFPYSLRSRGFSLCGNREYINVFPDSSPELAFRTRLVRPAETHYLPRSHFAKKLFVLKIWCKKSKGKYSVKKVTVFSLRGHFFITAVYFFGFGGGLRIILRPPPVPRGAADNPSRSRSRGRSRMRRSRIAA